jgi:alpha-1,3-mannosyltransferase
MMNLNFHFGLVKTIFAVVFVGIGQVFIGAPFLTNNADAYLSKAFEFKRVFMFKWSVNWQFLGEQTATSKEFATLLIVT